MIFTVVGMGVFIHWLIPSLPIAVAFALAAVLSPTDPIAVSAIASRTPLPPRLMYILEGESLLNDASGLVCFRFAVAAAVTGSFSLLQAAVSFGQTALGGLVIGVGVAGVIGSANAWIVRRSGEEPGIQVLISLLVPFAAYLAAEHLQVSGILSAATAGIAMRYVDLWTRPLAATRMQRRVVWSTVQLAFNGAIFVLLGQQIPLMLGELPQILGDAGADARWRLALYVVAITLGMTALRLAWVWTSLTLTLFARRRRQRADERKPQRLGRPVWLAAFAGVRGAITLAGILTLPLTLPGGAAFPGRQLSIVLAAGVILTSLLLASIALPLLARGLEFAPNAEASARAREMSARSAAAAAALLRIEQVGSESHDGSPENAVAAARVSDIYQRRLDHAEAHGEDVQELQSEAEAERRLRLAALAAERDELYRLRMSHQIDDVLHQRLTREIDLMEAALSRPSSQ